jgi:predicted RNA-binding protein with EMAP domain
MSKKQLNFWGMKREQLEVLVKELQAELDALKIRYAKVVNLNVQIVEQLKRQVEMAEEMRRLLKEKDGKKERDNLKVPRQKSGYA